MELRFMTAEETIAFGRRVGQAMRTGMCISLSGDLGAGKTTLTKGIAQGLDIDVPVNSPTFTIMKVYEGRLPLYHIDAYRLEGTHQDLGFEEYIQGDGVCVIEWPIFVKQQLPSARLDITLETIEDGSRKADVKAFGVAYEPLLEEIK